MTIQEDHLDDAGRDEAAKLQRLGMLALEQAMRARLAKQQTERDRVIREADQAQERLDAQKDAVEASLSITTRDEWWNEVREKPEAVAEKYAQARAWRDDSPTIAKHEERLRGELKTRYGIVVADTDEALLSQADSLNVQAQHDRAEAENVEQSFEPDDTQAQSEANDHWDSAERREALAEHLRDQGLSAEKIETIQRLDVHQAHRPGAAPNAKAPQTPRVQARLRGRATSVNTR